MERVINFHPVEKDQILVTGAPSYIKVGIHITGGHNPWKDLNGPEDILLHCDGNNPDVFLIEDMNTGVDLCEFSFPCFRNDNLRHLHGNGIQRDVDHHGARQPHKNAQCFLLESDRAHRKRIFPRLHARYQIEPVEVRCGPLVCTGKNYIGERKLLGGCRIRDNTSNIHFLGIEDKGKKKDGNEDGWTHQADLF